MGLIGSLIGRLTLEDQSFVVPLRKARAEISATEKEFTAATNKMKAASAGLKNIAAGFIGGFAFAGIQQAIQGGLDYASSLGEVAQQLGVTTRTLQEYRYVATQTGVSQDAMDAGLAKLTRSIGEAAAGGKSQAAAFAALGISIRGANGDLQTTDAILPQLVSAFSAIEDPAVKAKLAIALFGKAGQQLVPLLSAGSAEIDNLRDAANRLGVVLGDEQIAKADETADKLAAVSTVLKANISGVVADNAGSIITLAESLGSLAKSANNALPQYAGLLRILKNEGWKGVGKSFIGLGTDQMEAATAHGYSQAKIREFNAAIANHRRVRTPASLRAATEAQNAAQAAVRAEVAASAAGRRKPARPSSSITLDDPLASYKAAMSGGGGRKKTGGTKATKAPKADDPIIVHLPKEYFTDAITSELGAVPGSALEGWRDDPVMTREFQRIGDALEKNIKPKFEESANAVRDFADAMGRLRSDIKGGDFFSIVGSVLDVVVKTKSMFGGFRANGGPVSFGKSYIVGERGPELFVPGAAGRIVSNDNINAGAPPVVQLVVGEGQLFEPRVTSISGNVSVQTIGATQRRNTMRARRGY